MNQHAGHDTIRIETTYLRECFDCDETYDPGDLTPSQDYWRDRALAAEAELRRIKGEQ